jgi:hypothetical protein
MAELRYTLEQVPSQEQLAFVETALRASFKVTSCSSRDGSIAITHEDPECAEAIRAMTKRFIFISRSINKDLVFSNDVPVRYEQDPQPELESRREVIPIQPGFYSLQGDFLRAFQGVKRAVRRLAGEVGAIEQEHPAVWPVRLFKMIDYFHDFPQQVILCAPVKEDFQSRSTFSKRYGKTQAYESVAMDGLMADSSYGLQPAVCDCCYYALEGAREHPDTYYTTCNKVFRNERGTRAPDRHAGPLPGCAVPECEDRDGERPILRQRIGDEVGFPERAPPEVRTPRPDSSSRSRYRDGLGEPAHGLLRQGVRHSFA